MSLTRPVRKRTGSIVYKDRNLFRNFQEKVRKLSIVFGRYQCSGSPMYYYKRSILLLFCETTKYFPIKYIKKRFNYS